MGYGQRPLRVSAAILIKIAKVKIKIFEPKVLKMVKKDRPTDGPGI